jgi:hypothetical protein
VTGICSNQAPKFEDGYRRRGPGFFVFNVRSASADYGINHPKVRQKRHAGNLNKTGLSTRRIYHNDPD